MDTSTITCSTPRLVTTSLTPLDYALLFDDAQSQSTIQARLPISVQPDPSNFTLEGSQEVTSGMATLIRIVVRPIASTLTLLLLCVCIQGDNLDSVEAREVGVTVGGEECTLRNLGRSEIICTAPLEPPRGENLAFINVRY